LGCGGVTAGVKMGEGKGFCCFSGTANRGCGHTPPPFTRGWGGGGVGGGCFHGSEAPGYYADHSPLPSAEVRMSGTTPS